MARSAQEVVEAHLAAVAKGDMVTILEDYRDDVVILTPQGVLEGLSGVETFFTQALTALPELELTPKSVVYAPDVALLLWTATSTAGRVNDGVDTYVLENGAIKFETISFTVEPA